MIFIGFLMSRLKSVFCILYVTLSKFASIDFILPPPDISLIIQQNFLYASKLYSPFAKKTSLNCSPLSFLVSQINLSSPSSLKSSFCFSSNPESFVCIKRVESNAFAISGKSRGAAIEAIKNSLLFIIFRLYFYSPLCKSYR